MDISEIPTGEDAPNSFNVIIEVPQGVNPIKYEIDKSSGALYVDRFLHTSMYYPCNYGFIPHTLSGDGDPADVLVVSRLPLQPGCVIKCRPIGMLMMEDESGTDEKILALPVTKIEPYYENIKTYHDLPEILLDQISHFFEHYKDLEKKKWVKVIGWRDKKEALNTIEKAIADNIIQDD